ncbi:MAG: hypothetical protein GEU83_01510 [Pseudonocardiaceae bacterium]|nr:hypothetical protein [Pseudonocardiaceae bacterium]
MEPGAAQAGHAAGVAGHLPGRPVAQLIASTVYLRWGAKGIFTLAVASIVVVGGLVALLSWQRQWALVGNWFADQSAVVRLAGWPALLAAVLAGQPVEVR